MKNPPLPAPDPFKYDGTNEAQTRRLISQQLRDTQAQLDAAAITLDDSKLLGRGDSSAGAPEAITLGTGLSMSGTTLNGNALAVAGAANEFQLNNGAGGLTAVTGLSYDGNLNIPAASEARFAGDIFLSGDALQRAVFRSQTLGGGAGRRLLNYVYNDSFIGYGELSMYAYDSEATWSLRALAQDGEAYLTGTSAGVLSWDGHYATFARAINLAPVAGDIASPVDGDIWFDDTANKFRAREGGATVDLISTPTNYGQAWAIATCRGL